MTLFLLGLLLGSWLNAKYNEGANVSEATTNTKLSHSNSIKQAIEASRVQTEQPCESCEVCGKCACNYVPEGRRFREALACAVEELEWYLKTSYELRAKKSLARIERTLAGSEATVPLAGEGET